MGKVVYLFEITMLKTIRNNGLSQLEFNIGMSSQRLLISLIDVKRDGCEVFWDE